KRVEEGLPRRGRGSSSESVEVDELAAKTENSFVEYVVKFDYWSQRHSLGDFEVTRHVDVENELAGTAAGVARHVSGLADRRERELVENRWIERLTRPPP